VTARVSPRIPVPDHVLGEVRRLYEAGRFLDAFTVSREAGELRDWSGARARIMGARLAARLMGERLRRYLVLTTWRESPLDAEACLYRGYDMFESKGPLAVWRFTDDLARLQGLTSIVRADLLALRERVPIVYRDFGVAWRLLEEARAIAPDAAWIRNEIATCLAMEERPEEALAACDDLLARWPGYPPAIGLRASLLTRLARVDEALCALDGARAVLQSPELVGYLIALKRDRDDFHGMLELLDEWERLSPLAEPDARRWLAGSRCDALCLAGDYAHAAMEARRVDAGPSHPYYHALAERLTDDVRSPRRVRLGLPKEVQSHRTCGPATLAMLAAYWGHPTSQEQITEAICYDGTFNHSERQWCLDEGLAAREFTLSWESARMLLDAGVPFVLTTTDATAGHSQAVMGYDEARRTLLIQDPGTMLYREFIVDAVLACSPPGGLRCMAVVPRVKETWLNERSLPDAELRDRQFELQRALARCDRTAAQEALAALRSAAPDDSLTWLGEESIAAFDGDTVGAWHAHQQLVRLCPRDPRLRLRHLYFLRELGRREERLAFLHGATRGAVVHPAFWRELAVELSDDARDRRAVWHWLGRCHRFAPMDDAVLSIMGRLWWREGQRELAVSVLRFAASYADKNEQRVAEWCLAMRGLGARDAALDWLRRRASTLGAKAPGPWLTLAAALDGAQHTDEAIAVLGSALARHPAEGPLLTMLARLEVRLGRLDEASAHLEAARAVSAPGTWRRADAALLKRQGKLVDARRAWQAVLESEPLALDAHEAVASLSLALEGQESARATLERACGRFPHHLGLHHLLVAWLGNDGPTAEVEAAIRRLIGNHPTDAWAHRELASVLSRTGRHDAALASAHEALTLAPEAPQSHGVLASVLAALGRGVEAREACHAALRLDVGYVFAIGVLLDTATDARQARADLGFVHAEMIRQVVSGEVLQVYRARAFPLLEPRELLGHLLEARHARPDLWEATSAVIHQLTDMGETERALDEARAALGSFSLLPRAWHDVAVVHRRRGETGDAVAAVRHCVDLDPDWDGGWCFLADLLEDCGRIDEALAVLESAFQRLPLEASLHAMRSGILERAGRLDEAFQSVLELARLHPTAGGPWERARALGARFDRGEEVASAAREVARQRPGEASSWLNLARALPPTRSTERLAAVEEAIRRVPRYVDAYDTKAMLLASEQRFEEARQACRPDAFVAEPQPLALAGREAWLLALAGKTQEAIVAMERLLAANPDYYWGWDRLADWSRRLDDHERARTAVRAMVRLAPANAHALATAGDVEAEAGDTSAAADLYSRSLRLYPGGAGVLDSLCRMHWERGELSSLEAALTIPATGSAPWIAKGWRMLLAVKRGDSAAVDAGLAELVTCPAELDDFASFVDREMVSLSQALRVDRAIATAVSHDTVGMSFAALHVRRSCERGDWDVWRSFRAWSARAGERALRPVLIFLEAIGDAGRAAAALPELIDDLGPWLRERTPLYGMVGYALANSGLARDAEEWLRHCEHRPDAQGAIVANCVGALWQERRYDDAARVSQVVLQRDLRDQTWVHHVAAAVYGHALGGRLDEAEAALAKEPAEQSQDPEVRWTLELGRSVLRVLRLSGTDARRAYVEERKRLRSLGGVPPQFLPQVRERYERALSLMARHAGTTLWPWERRVRVARSPSSAAAAPLADSLSPTGGIVIAMGVLALARACQ
jgi:tetratricopeptide (TPR) repeat protein